MTASNRSSRASRPAFTLVEVVLAAALGAIVFIGLQSAILISVKALPTTGQLAQTTLQATFLGRLETDLTYATAIDATKFPTIILTVPDRNADAMSDTITYEWSGNKGDPIERSFNASEPEVMLPHVNEWSFSLTTVNADGTPPAVESTEAVLASHITGANASNREADAAAWTAQYVPLTFAADVASFRVTRVRLWLRRNGATTGQTSVEIRGMRGATPAGRALATATAEELDLPATTGGVTFSFAGLSGLNPAEDLAIVLRATSNAPSADIQFDSGGATAARGYMLTTTNSGGTWSVSAAGCLYYEILGTTTKLGATPSVRVARSVVIQTQSGDAPPLEISLPFAGKPEVAQ